MNMMSSLLTVLPRYRHSADILLSSVAEQKPERKARRDFLLCAHTAPDRRRSSVRITCGQQHLRLMRARCFRCFVPRRPPAKAPLRQTFRRQPEALTVVGQNADGFRTPAAKQKQTAGKRIS